jgi:TorA maturation chaperone TorD
MSVTMESQALGSRRAGEHAVPRRDSQDSVRANTYSLLAALLAAPPSEDLLSLLRDVEVPEGEDGAVAATWGMLSLAARYASPAVVDDEYHALFIGITGGELNPYGSWYMTGAMMDKPLVYLRRDLQQLGIERQEGVCEPEDHAAALCEAMAVIITSPEGLGFGTQKEFFEAHMGPWMEQFFRDMQKAGAANFYRAVGRLGEQFIGIERRYLEMPG